MKSQEMIVLKIMIIMNNLEADSMVISNQCNHISIHTNASQLNDSKLEEIKHEQEEESDTDIVKNIVDVSQIARNLFSKEIRLLNLHDLISDIEILQTIFVLLRS